MSLYPLSWECITRSTRPRRSYDNWSPECLLAIFTYHDVEHRDCPACRHGYSGHAQLVSAARAVWAWTLTGEKR